MIKELYEIILSLSDSEIEQIFNDLIESQLLYTQDSDQSPTNKTSNILRCCNNNFKINEKSEIIHKYTRSLKINKIFTN